MYRLVDTLDQWGELVRDLLALSHQRGRLYCPRLCMKIFCNCCQAYYRCVIPVTWKIDQAIRSKLVSHSITGWLAKSAYVGFLCHWLSWYAVSWEYENCRGPSRKHMSSICLSYVLYLGYIFMQRLYMIVCTWRVIAGVYYFCRSLCRSFLFSFVLPMTNPANITYRQPASICACNPLKCK